MERQPVRGMAVADAVGRTSGSMSRLRFRLGALSQSRQEAAWFGVSLCAIAVAMGAFLRVAYVRWESFETNSFDLAFFDQIIFNTSQGRWFGTSFVTYNFAGQHLEPILLAFVPAYWLGAGPFTLMVTQALAGAAAAIPLYFFAKRLGLHAAIATAGVVAYLANPYLHRAMAFDFHPEVMVALPAFVSAWAIVAGRRRFAMATALSVLLFKEDAVFIALALAGLMWLQGMRRPAAVTAGVALAYAAIAVLVVMPIVRGGQSSDLVERFGYLLPSHSPRDVLHAPFRAAQVLLGLSQIWTMMVFVAASSVVALWRPWLLTAIVPGLALALLSAHPQQRHLEFHYAAELVPVMAIAGMLAAKSLRERLPVAAVAGMVAVPTLLAMMVMNPFAEAHGDPPSAQHRAAVLGALALVPADDSVEVSAQSGLLPRLAHRESAHEFPGNAETAEWIVVDRYGFRSSQSLAAGFDERLESVRETAERVYAQDGVEVFRRLR
ncbi:MAG: DUF2079 domain-containing protein [Dehalococcoidia bacterium]